MHTVAGAYCLTAGTSTTHGTHHIGRRHARLSPPSTRICPTANQSQPVDDASSPSLLQNNTAYGCHHPVRDIVAPPHIKAADYIVKQVFEQQGSPYYKTEKKNITLSFAGGWPTGYSGPGAGLQCLMVAGCGRQAGRQAGMA
jgi:hypothetical protein